MKDLRISVSQIKTFNASPSKWAGMYILWIKDEFQNDNYDLWNLFENWLITKQDILEEYLDKNTISDIPKFVNDYDNLKYNSEWLDIKIWQTQYKLEWQLFGVDILGYIDNLTDEYVEDIKTTRYLTKEDTKSINMWSGMTTIEEYKLQLRVYCKLLWRKKARIIEIPKHKYKDWPKHQILEYNYDEVEKEMSEKIHKIVEEIKSLWIKTDKIRKIINK